jgi:UDP-N-acetyl-2-amino-2-deoxyglucuronate dehydrogenase
MSNDTVSLGTALVGCGKVGVTHANALQILPESHFVAAYDASAERAEQFGARYGVRAYTNLGELLDDPRVQMVSVCTPNYSHTEVVQVCASAGRHVLVEKPMAIDLLGCDLMIRAADQYGIKLGVVSQRRLYPPVQRVRQAILAGKIGRPALGTLTVMGWRDEGYYQMDPWRGKWATEGGGVLVTQTTHQLDLFQWFMGPIQEVFGYWQNINHPYIEVEDSAVAVVRFVSGAMGTILVSNSQQPGFYGKIHVHGSNGASVGVQTDGGSPFVAGVTSTVEPPVNDIWTVPGEEQLLTAWQAEDIALCQRVDVMSYFHELQIQDFLRAILEDRQPIMDGREGRKHVELFTAIYRSQGIHAPVQFPLLAQDLDSELKVRKDLSEKQ